MTKNFQILFYTKMYILISKIFLHAIRMGGCQNDTATKWHGVLLINYYFYQLVKKNYNYLTTKFNISGLDRMVLKTRH